LVIREGMGQEVARQRPAASSYRQFWLLDPDVVFLNHGSFGACPMPVLAAQQRLREQLERQPLLFFNHDFEPLLDAARSQLAQFVGAEATDLVFVPNATTGINAVLRSLSLGPDDELLTTNQEYNACRNALNYVAQRTGAQVVVADIPFPLASPDQVVGALLRGVSDRTRLVLVDQVTSQTGLIFPIAQLVQELGQREIEILVDGAHAPGMLPLDLRQLGVTYYTGNCHKWLCAPKGSAFLYVQGDRQLDIRPLTISHGANSPRSDRSRFWLEFDWMGTADPTAYLCVPEAIQFMGSLLPGGWPELMATNHQLAIAARQTLCTQLAIEPPCPDSLLGSLAVIPLPDGPAQALQDRLYQDYGIEVPVIPWNGSMGRQIRISAQIYNRLEQYRYLGDALVECLQAENRKPTLLP